MTDILMICDEGLFSDAVYSALMCANLPDEISFRHISAKSTTFWRTDIIIYVPSGLRREEISLITSIRRQNPETRQLNIISDLDTVIRTDPRIEYMHRNNRFEVMAEIISTFMREMGKGTKIKKCVDLLKTARGHEISALSANLSRLYQLDEFYLQNNRAGYTQLYKDILDVAFNQVRRSRYAYDIMRRSIALYLNGFFLKFALDLGGINRDMFYILDTPTPDQRQIERVFFRLSDIIFTQHLDIDPTEAVVKMKEYINAHFLENITLSSIAETVGGNASYLSHLFSKECGETVKEYISKLKIVEAKRLLKETKLSVKEIAKKLGFTTANYFVRFFKEKVGLPPQEWRESD